MTGYRILYRFEFDGFCNPFNEMLISHNKILILKKDYTGTITDIPYGQVGPVEIDYPTADDDIFYPLKGSSLTFKVLGGVINMDSIISEDEKEYIIEYYRGDNLFWKGFVSPELCDEDIFLRYPAIEFKTIDGLSTLKKNRLDLDDKMPEGILNLLKVLQGALNGIGYEYPLNVLCKIWNEAHSKTDYSTPLEQTYVYTPSLKDNNFEFRSDLELLLDICQVFNAFVYQNYGEWYYVKPKDLIFGITGASKFAMDGTLNTTSKKTIPTLVHGTDFKILAEPKRRIRRFYKYTEVEYQGATNKFINGDCSIWSEGQNEIAITDTLSLFGTSLAQTTFKFFNKGTTVKSYLLYSQLENKYKLGITSTDAHNAFNYFTTGKVDIRWGEGFNVSVQCPTKNPTFSLIIQIPYITGVAEYYYDFLTGVWSNSPKYYQKSSDYPTDDNVTSYSQQFPFPDILNDWEVYQYEAYSVYLVLYSGQKIGYSTVYESWYSDIIINGPKPLTYLGNQLPTREVFHVDNLKYTSIIPEKKKVYSGDNFNQKEFTITDIQEPSAFLYKSEGEYYPMQSYYTDIFTGKVRGSWQEREEEERYTILEYCTRNILNQYSDYRNIFVGTLIGIDLQYGAIYEFPNQGPLAGKKFWPLSMKLNDFECTAEVVFMELTSNEIYGQLTRSRYDDAGLLITADVTASEKKKYSAIGTDLGEVGKDGTIFDRFTAFFLDDFIP
jgi:hypothetical protein